MIISIEELKNQIVCGCTTTDEQIAVRLGAIEAVIRAYTNNNFQNRAVRFSGQSNGMEVHGKKNDPQYLRTGDTVQISASGVNDGLYVVTSVTSESITVDKELLKTDYNLVTKVQYPADVVQCAVDLFKWKQNMGDKVGIKSETISRHSVTYEDSGTLFMGYPVGILEGLRLHKKARC